MTADVGLQPLRQPDSVLRAARRVKSQFRFSFDGQDSDVVRVPPGNVMRLVQQLAATVTASVRQIIPLTAHSRHAVGSFSDTVWQSLAEDANLDIVVDRLYLVPPGAIVPESEAKFRSTAYTGGRFRVRFVAVDELMENDFTLLPDSNIWLIDDTVVVAEEPDELARWQVSARPTDVVKFRRVWDGLWKRASVDLASKQSFAEPLAQSADMMATIAKMSCNGKMYAEGTCSWYHGIWQYLRLVNLVSSPAWHSPFYRKALYDAFRSHAETHGTQTRATTVITGAADYGMLAYVLNASDRGAVYTDVHVIDQCTTPLIACEWYARLWGIPTEADDDRKTAVRTTRANVLDIRAAVAKKMRGRVDLVATDAFLTRFPGDEASDVVRLWFRLLRPGGVVVTTVRVHPLDDPISGGVLDEVSSFAVRARQRAECWRPYVNIDLDQFTTAARQYAMQMRSYDLGDVSAVRNLFTTIGFKIEYAERERVSGELRPTTYLRIVARKPSAR
jgi:hypothetical protein